MSEIVYCIAISDTYVAPQNYGSNEAILRSGELFQIVNENNSGRFIKIYTTRGKELLGSADIYKLPNESDYKVVDPCIWNMLIAFKNKYRRLKFFKYEKFLQYLMSLKVGAKVILNGYSLGREWNNNSSCEVRYIGPVPEMGPGTYIGFMLLVRMKFLHGNHKSVITSEVQMS